MLAHAGAVDESLSVILVLAGLWTAWAAATRLRGRGFPRVPLPVAWVGLTLAIVLVVSALIVPARIFPASPAAGASPASRIARPASTAALAIVRPGPGARAAGEDLEVVLRLDGGRVVDATSSTLTPDTGHVHLALDGRTVSMTYGLVQSVSLRSVAPGEHTLQAEFVAADHGPFSPRVTVTTTFVREPA